MKTKFIILLGAIVSVAIIIIIMLTVPVKQQPKNEVLLADLRQIEQFALAGKKEMADGLLSKIEKSNITNTQLLLKLAKINLLLKNKNTACKYTEKAWKMGAKKTETVILLLIANSKKNKKSLFAYISRFLEELPDTPANNIFIAGIYQDFNHSDKAQKIWLRYFNDKHIPAKKRAAYALKIARSRILQNNIHEASKIMQSLQNKGCMSLPAYNMYISLALLNNNSDKFEKLFEEAITQYNSTELQLKRGLSFIYKGNFTKADKVLEKLQMPSTSSISDLAVNYNARMYLALIRIMKSGKKAFFLDLIYNSKESSIYLKENRGKSKLLKLPISPTMLEAEIVFYKALSDLFTDKPQSMAAFKAKVPLFQNQHPVIDFFILKAGLIDGSDIVSIIKTSQFLLTGKISLIEGLHGLFIMSPPVVAEMSQILYSVGAYKQAKKLLTSLNNRKKFTAKEINMLLKLAIKTNNSKLLDSLVKLKNINTFIDIEILEAIKGKPELEAKLYNNGIFKAIYLANAGKTAEALSYCDSLHLSQKKSNLLKAQIYAANNKKQEAEKFFKKSLNPADNFWGYREYAKFLLHENKIAEAEKLYKEILSRTPHDNTAIIGIVNTMEIKGKLDEAISLLNNNISSDNPEIFLKLAKLHIKQNDFPIALRYTNKVLRALGKYDEAIFLKTVALIGIYEQYPTDQNKQSLYKMSNFLKKLIEKNRIDLIFTAYIETLYSLKKYNSLLAETHFIQDNSANTWLLKKKIISMIHTEKLKSANAIIQKYSKDLDKDFVAFAKAELNAAEKKYTVAVELLKNSKNHNLRYKAAEFAVKAHNIKTAEHIMKTISPSYLEWGRLADIAISEKNQSFAFKCYDNALELAPENPLILNNYAYLLADTGTMPAQKAISMIKQAYLITPTNGILATYIFILEKYHKYAQCKTLIKKHNLLKQMSPQLIASYLAIMKKKADNDEIILVMNNILQRKDSFWENYPYKKETIKRDFLNLHSNNMK